MAIELNFEAEPLQNEDAFSGEAEEESEVRDNRRQPGGGPRPGGVAIRQPPRGGPGSRIPFIGRPIIAGRPMVIGRPIILGGPRFGGRFIPRRRFGPGFGPLRPRGFRRRFGFLRRPPFGLGFGTGVGQPLAGFGGAVSELVSWAQGCLSQIGGEPVPQNGILGPATRRAVAAFQTQNQLAATGVLDNQTIAALQAACAPADSAAAAGTEGGE